jgi:GT2 family glycosyltransferase
VAQIVPLPEHLATPFGAFRSAAMALPPPTEPLPEVEMFASGFAVVPRSSLLEIGGYNEDYPTAALEDADLFIRARQNGTRVRFDPKLLGTHNDWAGTTLRDFCQRQRVYCQTAPLLKERFGSEPHPWSALIDANSPPQRGADNALVIIQKRVKYILSRRAPLATLLWAADLLERRRGMRRLLWAVYRASVAASMYDGYQEGLATLTRRLDEPQSPDP